MARIRELAQTWTFSGSTGAGKAIEVSPSAALFSCYYLTSSGCTATVSLETTALSTLGPWVTLSPSTAMSTGAALLQQFSGPFEYLRPRVSAIKASTDVVTVRVIAN